ncbi:hypothetical protein IWQ62_002848 [Dispira parvispora]|uniref:SCP domain-containing protein n=1 Tax=Dispira parvispora TaxID=1520584 RepID=A0A9W8AP43_9FUNG|nr:hypothetical protein IWQ62_002848 [Dispira parvispora]
MPEPSTNSTGNPNNMTEEEIYASNVRLCKLIIKEVFATVEKMPEVAPLSSPGNEANQTLILQLLNNYRTSNDLHPLHFDPRLEKVTLKALQDFGNRLSTDSDNVYSEIGKRLKQSNIDYTMMGYTFSNVTMNEWDIMRKMVTRRYAYETVVYPCYTHAALAATEGKWLIIFTQPA